LVLRQGRECRRCRHAELARQMGRPPAVTAAHAHRREDHERSVVANTRGRTAPRTGICVRVVRPGSKPLHGDRLMRRARASSRERGIALIAVLWLTILLTVIASGFAFSMHGEA